jgi:hypothetical protein
MNRTRHRNACSWSDIKGRLDPAWSYVVIETTAASPGDDVFDTVAALLAAHADGIRSQEICRETDSGNLLMLVQVHPEQTETIKRKLLDPRLPPSVTVFFYDHAPAGAKS